MSTVVADKTTVLSACLGTYAHTRALKEGAIEFEFGETQFHRD